MHPVHDSSLYWFPHPELWQLKTARAGLSSLGNENIFAARDVSSMMLKGAQIQNAPGQPVPMAE
jgi:hypothetical protein